MRSLQRANRSNNIAQLHPPLLRQTLLPKVKLITRKVIRIILIFSPTHFFLPRYHLHIQKLMALRLHWLVHEFSPALYYFFIFFDAGVLEVALGHRGFWETAFLLLFDDAAEVVAGDVVAVRVLTEFEYYVVLLVHYLLLIRIKSNHFRVINREALTPHIIIQNLHRLQLQRLLIKCHLLIPIPNLLVIPHRHWARIVLQAQLGTLLQYLHNLLQVIFRLFVVNV